MLLDHFLAPLPDEVRHVAQCTQYQHGVLQYCTNSPTYRSFVMAFDGSSDLLGPEGLFIASDFNSAVQVVRLCPRASLLARPPEPVVTMELGAAADATRLLDACEVGLREYFDRVPSHWW